MAPKAYSSNGDGSSGDDVLDTKNRRHVGDQWAVFGAATTTQPAAVADAVVADPVDVPAGGVGAAAGGWDTAANRDLAITRINLAWDLVIEQKAQLNALLARLRTLGVIAT